MRTAVILLVLWAVTSPAWARVQPRLESRTATTQWSAGTVPAVNQGCTVRYVGPDAAYEAQFPATYLSSDFNECLSYGLAHRYGDPADVVRLIKAVASPKLSTQRLEMFQTLPERFFQYEFTYPDKTVTAINPRVEDLSKDAGCKLVRFFGVNTYCFNKVVSQGAVTKPNQLSGIIRSLLFLKVSTSGVQNYLLNAPVDPFQFIASHEILYVDATDYSQEDQMAIAPTYGYQNVRCGDGRGSMNFQFRSATDLTTGHLEIANSLPVDKENNGIYTAPAPPVQEVRRIVFVCEPPRVQYAADLAKITYTGILYHEANHVLAQHGWFTSSCEFDEKIEGKRYDNGFASVYGSHILLLLAQSSNPGLTQEERCIAYNQAVIEASNKLCQGYQIGESSVTCPQAPVR